MSFQSLSFITHYIIKIIIFKTWKIKVMSWGYYISPPLIFNTVLSVLFVLSSLSHSRTWRDMVLAFYPPFPKLPLQDWSASIALLFEWWLDSGVYIPSCLECGKVWSRTRPQVLPESHPSQLYIMYIYIYLTMKHEIHLVLLYYVEMQADRLPALL